jgi:hypothetical protein
MLFAFAALAAASAPALAQYYPVPGGPAPGYYIERDYYRPVPRPRPQYRPPYQEWGGGGYYQRPVAFGNVCVTSRGNCRTRPRPEQTPCSCNIPGFGLKRGAIYAGY